MIRTNRLYRLLRITVSVLAAVCRYLWLMGRDRIRWIRPSQAAWDRAHARTGRAVYRLATHLGGALVKLGQVMGARADFLPGPFVEPLRGLHDQVPARPFGQLRKHVEEQLEAPLEHVFEHVDEEPLAAASLAQVHRARLADGHDVVIKVQYPEAAKLFPSDLGMLRKTVRVARWLNRHLDLRTLVDELAQFVCLELEFDREARSTERVRIAFADTPRIRVAHIHTELSTPQLLVMDFIEGTGIARVDELRAQGFDLRDLAQRVAQLYCTMIFEHEFFHGDPHPGNILVCPDGTLALLDFGLAKELPPGFARGVAQMIVKAMSGDSVGAVEAARTVGFEVNDGDPEAFRELLGMLTGDYASGSGFMNALKATNLENVPGHFTLIVRVFVLLNGLSHTLVPGERVIAMALMGALAPFVQSDAA